MNINKKNSYWIAIGIGVGSAIGVAVDDLAVWIAVGAGFGFVMTQLSTLNFNSFDKKD